MQSLLLSSVSPFPRISSLNEHHHHHHHHRLPPNNCRQPPAVTTTTTTTTTSPRPGLRAPPPPLPSPYLSPPMSRSPPPPSENSSNTQDRRQEPKFTPNTTTNTTNTTPNTTTATASTASSSVPDEPPAAPVLPPLGDHLPAQRRSDDRPQTQAQPQPQMPGRLRGGGPYLGDQHQPPASTTASATASTAPVPTTSTASTTASAAPDAVYLPLTPLATSLPPRTTRRAKAHVPSACVNCKHKHLGCDPERPCRRCVASGKEATCKDVTHKKRGRPPLRAEESLMRHFETPFGVQDPSSREPPRLQMSPPSTRPNQHQHQHQRTSSREIRPMTELQFPRPGDSPMEPGGRPGGMPPHHPPMWAPPPGVASSPLNRPVSSHGDLAAAGRPFSSGSSYQSTQAPPSPFFSSSPGGRPPQQHHSPAARARPVPPYRSFGPSIIPPPQQSYHPQQQQQQPQQPQQQPPSLPSPFSPYHHHAPRSPYAPAISEASGTPASAGPAPRDVGTRPRTAESPAEFRLPPIWTPSPISGGADQTQHRRPGEVVPPPLQAPSREITTYEQVPSQTRPRESTNPYPPHPLQPAFQATSAPHNRPMTARELPPSLPPPVSLPPMSVPSQSPGMQATTQRESGGSVTAAAGNTDGKEEEQEQESPRPRKRRKMTLGEMVNN